METVQKITELKLKDGEKDKKIGELETKVTGLEKKLELVEKSHISLKSDLAAIKLLIVGINNDKINPQTGGNTTAEFRRASDSVALDYKITDHKWPLLQATGFDPVFGRGQHADRGRARSIINALSSGHTPAVGNRQRQTGGIADSSLHRQSKVTNDNNSNIEELS